MLSTRMHVNYSFPVFAFLAILIPSLDWRYAIIGITITLNALIDWEVFDEWISDRALLKTAHLVNAGVYVAMFAFLLATTYSIITRVPREGKLHVPLRALVALVAIVLVAATTVWFIWIRE
jgi:hypothetical protein